MVRNLFWSLLLLVQGALFGESLFLERVFYPLTNDPIDVVIPSCPKDLDTLELCIQGIKEHAQNIRRIIVISKEPMTESAEWFPEGDFPFSKESIAEEIFRGNSEGAQNLLTCQGTRIGWIYQQFLKLYASITIPDLSPNTLIVDSDVIFLRPVSFMTEEGNPLFATSTEYHQLYFDQGASLLPGWHRAKGCSGIVHHMLFQRPIIEDLLSLIESTHSTDAWRGICRCISASIPSSQILYGACLSEYEIYFNFVFLRSDQGIIRPLRWANVGAFNRDQWVRQGYDYVASHRFLRDWGR